MWRHCLISSPEPLGSLVSYSIGMIRRPSVVRCRPLSVRPPFSKIFFSKTLVQWKPNFIWSFNGNGGTKVCSRGLGHMTKMNATPIYGKTPSEIFFSELKGNDLMALHVVLEPWAHHSLFKWCLELSWLSWNGYKIRLQRDFFLNL